jgi:K+ transporter
MGFFGLGVGRDDSSKQIPGHYRQEVAVAARYGLHDASYFLSKIELTKGGEPTMSAWRQNLFIATSKLSADAAESFCLPRDRTLITGSRIAI